MNSQIKKVFLYGELQTNVGEFPKEAWEPINKKLKNVKGLIRKTWLIGIGNNSAGGLYEFDSVENARAFATGPYLEEANALNASLTVKLFDGDKGEQASRAMESPHYDY